MSPGWIVQATGNPRFSVRIAIEEDGRTLFAVRAQEAWPGAKGHIFCIRDGSSAEEQGLFKEIERVPVLSYDRFGRSIRIVLDRPTKKRCEFLILKKSYKNREGSYEQIFFKTQSASEAHKSRSRVALGTAKTTLTIVIDSAERYPWKFPKAQIERRKLPAGDYALVEGEKILATVERKTFDNLLTDFSRIGPLHQILEELSSFPFSAVVIEADYGDFLDPRQLKNRWPPSHGYRLIAELQAMHPRLPFIFARTRKEANLWTYGFFRAVMKRRAKEQKDEEAILAAEPIIPYSSTLRLEERILSFLSAEPEGLTLCELGEYLTDADTNRIRKSLSRLRSRGSQSSARLKEQWDAGWQKPDSILTVR
ncbi:MAG: ERCC4 domain-containing protein [Spirochaetales bacterium]|nr:ERCC4 domain-containing protein [Spirochaetales bacterium]